MFEHKRIYGHRIANNIKALEADGWEMCGIEYCEGETYAWFWFKRRKQPDHAALDKATDQTYHGPSLAARNGLV